MILSDHLCSRIHRHIELKIQFIICDSPQAYRSNSLNAEALIEMCERYDVEIAAFGDGLHAKVILIDNSIAIVTSANLTHGGLEGNLEMGFKIFEKEIIDKLSAEFETAWRAAEQLSTDDLKERLNWANSKEPPQNDETVPFRQKTRWRPVVTSGTGISYGIEIFDGFKKENFEILDPKTYGGSMDDDPVDPQIVDKIKIGIDATIKPILNKFYLGTKDYLPSKDSLFPHYASRRRVKNFYPSATWLGLGRDERRYVTLAQLAVGLFVDTEGSGLFANFNMGEEYEINEDKIFFLKWLSQHIPHFLKTISNLDPKYHLHYNHPVKGSVYRAIHEVDEDNLKELLDIPRDHHLDFHITRYYMLQDEWQLLKRSSVVWEVADQFEVLYPIYKKAFGN